MSSGRESGHVGDDESRPALQVVRGAPSVEELAALVAALAATTSAAPPDRPAATRRPNSWSAYWRAVRRPLQPGPDGWRRSAGPR